MLDIVPLRPIGGIGATRRALGGHMPTLTEPFIIQKVQSGWA